MAAKRTSADETPVELVTALDKLCYIVVKAREYDAKEDIVEPDPGSNPSDDKDVEILEDYGDDPTLEELTGALDALNDEEKTELLALIWLGRGDYAPEDWESARKDAEAVHDARETEYLLGTPNLGDLLEEALSLLGHSCESFDMGRL